MKGDVLLEPGTELHKFTFDGPLDWFISVTDPRIHWKYEPTYLIVQAVYVFGGIATLIHALLRGGRLPWFWLGTILHGLFIEAICFLTPDVDNYWHSQTPVMLLGRRFPIHILILYPCFIYNASVAVAKMRLPKWAEPFAVGLGSVLIDLPYDIICVKFVHWTWHDTDPNIYDRHYWAPWNSYYFHATFAASYTFWFHYLRRRFCESDGKWLKGKSLFMELFTTILAGILGPIGGVILFIPVYHPLHDIFKIHSEVTLFIIVTVFLLIIWSADRRPSQDYFTKTYTHKVQGTTWFLVLHLLVHYATFVLIPIFFNPEDEVSTGMKEPVGPCDEYTEVQAVSGMVLSKRKYFCPTGYDEKYFDFSCVSKLPSNGALWYTVCGTPFENRVEYIVITSLLFLLGVTVFYNLNFRSFGDEVFYEKYQKVNKEIPKSVKSKKRA